MYNSPRRAPRSQTSFSWTWIVAGGVVILLLLLKWVFGGTDTASSTGYLLITPSGVEGTVGISMTNVSKKVINTPEKLYATDKSVSVESGWIALAENEHMRVDLDKNTELTYISSTPTEDTIGVSKWRAWITAKQIPVVVKLKDFSLKVQPGNTVLIEQNNAYGIAYAITWTIELSTSIWSYNLDAGNRIMIGASDIASNTPLASLAGAIDETITTYTLFERNNGAALLSQLAPKSSSTATGASLISSGASTSGHFIEITDPIDGSVAKTNTVTVMGKILSKEVKRVTIDDRDASVSPVSETFILQNISVEKDIVNLVYKAYDSNNSLLEKGVIVVFASKGAKETQGRLVSNNFPISNKDFKITFPTENPYKTTDSVVKVQWTVPKDTVSYIVVNDYRLQKFVSNSTTWYYFANVDTKSMVDGINLYTIKFYSSDNTLLYSQLFTIVKESKNATVSGESIR